MLLTLNYFIGINSTYSQELIILKGGVCNTVRNELKVYIECEKVVQINVEKIQEMNYLELIENVSNDEL